MDDAGDNPPDLQFLSILQLDRRVIGILGLQTNLSGAFVEALDGELAINHGNDNGTMRRDKVRTALSW